MIFRTSCLFVFYVGLASTLDGMQLTAPPKTGQSISNKNIESFEFVWQTIKDSHWDANLVGETWDRSRQELLPRIQTAASIEEVREIISELIGRLGQSHFGIIPSDSYEVIGDEGAGGGNFDVGVTFRMVEGDLVATNVRPDSPAEKMGVTAGWTLSSIRDRQAGDLVDRFNKAAHGPQRAETIAGLTLARLASGRQGESIPLTFRDSNNQSRTMEIMCEKSPGTIVKLGNLPPMRVSDETKTLDGNIGYYNFNAFLDPIRIMPAYRKAIRDKSHSNGIIIDLRGNIGGLGAMTMGMAGEFVSEKQKLGTMTMKGTKLDFIANPRAKPITAPVAIIVDECSISSAEIFAGGLQDLGLARVFGNRTAGLALPSIVTKLPNGDGFQYAFADYHSANGQTLETNGVVPDEPIVLTKRDLVQFRDPALNAAINWIQMKNKQ